MGHYGLQSQPIEPSPVTLSIRDDHRDVSRSPGFSHGSDGQFTAWANLDRLEPNRPYQACVSPLIDADLSVTYGL